jgi:hypothetical protein
MNLLLQNGIELALILTPIVLALYFTLHTLEP